MDTIMTRSLLLRVDSLLENEEERKKEISDNWKLIEDLSYKTWKSSNMMITKSVQLDGLRNTNSAALNIPNNLVGNNQAKLTEEIYLQHGMSPKKTIPSLLEKIAKDTFGLPNCIANSLSREISRKYKNDKKEVSNGKRRLPFFRLGYPMPVAIKSTHLFKERDKFFINWTVKRGKVIRLQVIFKLKAKRKSTMCNNEKVNDEIILDRVLSGEYSHTAMKLQYKHSGKNKGDFYVLLPIKVPQKERKLNYDKSIGVDLGLSTLAYCGVSSGKKRLALGVGQEVLRVKTQMQSRKRRLSKNLKFAHGGHGKTRKIKALEHISGKEKNWQETFNHKVSKKVVDFALTNNAGTIKMEYLKGFGKDGDDKKNFIVRNWTYFSLQTKIEYKAKALGIKVVYVDPYHTSQTCSKCGHVDGMSRQTQAGFKCTACGNEENADYNASVNIARSTAIVTKQEECQYYKNIKNKKANA